MRSHDDYLRPLYRLLAVSPRLLSSFTCQPMKIKKNKFKRILTRRQEVIFKICERAKFNCCQLHKLLKCQFSPSLHQSHLIEISQFFFFVRILNRRQTVLSDWIITDFFKTDNYFFKLSQHLLIAMKLV